MVLHQLLTLQRLHWKLTIKIWKLTLAGPLAADRAITNVNNRNDKEYYEMKTQQITRCVCTVLVIFAVAAFLLPPIRAAEGTIDASVTISIPLEVNPVDVLGFGTLTPPTDPNVCAFWTLSAFDGLVLTSGEGEDPVALDHGRGMFRLIGDPGAAVTYSVAITTQFADPDLTLTVSADNVNPPTGTVILDDITGILEVQFGGVLEICDEVVVKTHNDAVITMTANY